MYQTVSSSQGDGRVAALITKRLKKQFIREQFAGLGQNGMGRQFETGRAGRTGPGFFVLGRFSRGGLARFSHRLTAEARNRRATTSLRLLAVLNVL